MIILLSMMTSVNSRRPILPNTTVNRLIIFEIRFVDFERFLGCVQTPKSKLNLLKEDAN